MAKKYVPNGVYLVCDKGLGFGKLKVTNHKNVRLYGKQMATEGDKVPMVNIPCLGICSITKTKCQPIPLLWQGVQQGITIGPYHKLLEDSKLPCSLSGKIGIHFSLPAALAAIEANVTAMQQRDMKSLGAKVDDWFQKGFDEQEKANNKVGGLYGKYANFKLGINEGIYGGVKGIGEGLVFLKEMGDKARGAALHAVTHPTETAGKVKDAYVATKNAVNGAADWVSTPGNVKKVASDFGQAHINAYNWATTPGNLENAGKAAITKTGEGLKHAGDWAAKQSPRDWGRYTGRTGFEVGLMFTGVGEAKAVVGGAEVVNVAAKTGEGANILAKTGEVAKAGKIAEEANATTKALEAAKAAEEAKKARTLGEVVSENAKKPKLIANTAEHKAARWAEYEESMKNNPKKWSYERWSKQYDTNMRNPKVGLDKEEDYRKLFGGKSKTVKTKFTYRQIDIYRHEEKYMGQLKTGKLSLTNQVRKFDIPKDAWLVKRGYNVEYILEKGGSKPLLEALQKAKIKYKIGSQIP